MAKNKCPNCGFEKSDIILDARDGKFLWENISCWVEAKAMLEEIYGRGSIKGLVCKVIQDFHSKVVG